MKTLKAICTAAVLTLVVSLPVFAGDIGTPGANAPAPGVPSSPAPTPASESPTIVISGDIGTPGLMVLLWTVMSAL